jgi:hypothetical protein
MADYEDAQTSAACRPRDRDGIAAVQSMLLMALAAIVVLGLQSFVGSESGVIGGTSRAIAQLLTGSSTSGAGSGSGSSDPIEIITMPGGQVGPSDGVGTVGSGSGGDGPPEYSSDPGASSLDHVDQECDPNLSKSPVSENGTWDAEKILSNLSQLETTPDVDSDARKSRCAAASLLAAATITGPDAVNDLITRLESEVKSPQLKQELADISQRLQDGSATLLDLSRVQEIMKQRFAPGNKVGMDGAQIAAMQKALANSTSPTTNHLIDRIVALSPGQSFTMAVDTDGDGLVNHATQVGRDASGRIFLYDPWPRDNQPGLIYQDEHPAAFEHYTTKMQSASFSDIVEY